MLGFRGYTAAGSGLMRSCGLSGSFVGRAVLMRDHVVMGNRVLMRNRVVLRNCVVMRNRGSIRAGVVRPLVSARRYLVGASSRWAHSVITNMVHGWGSANIASM